MSILIKGAKMPRHCGYCFFNDFNICQIEHCPVADAVYHEERHEDCPLVEIPPHGRLIDGAALKTKLNNIRDFLLGDCEFSELAMSDKARIDELINCIAEVVNAPTVIESEEQEHE